MIKYVKELNQDEQIWLVKAVIGIMLADGVLERDEVQFIKKLCGVFLDEKKETLVELTNLLREKTVPEIGDLRVDNAEKVVYMMKILSTAVFANGKKLHQERERYFEACRKLGVGIGLVSYKLALEAEQHRVDRKMEQVDIELIEEFEENYRKNRF